MISPWIFPIGALAAVALTIFALARSMVFEFGSVGPHHVGGREAFLRDELLTSSMAMPFLAWLVFAALGWGRFSSMVLFAAFVVAIGLVFAVRYSPSVKRSMERCEAARTARDKAMSQ